MGGAVRKSSRTAGPRPAPRKGKSARARRPAKPNPSRKLRERHAPLPSHRAGPKRIRIVVADELPLDRRSLVQLLATQPDFQVVGEAATTPQAAAMCAALEPSILLISVGMVGEAGRTPIVEIHAAAPQLPILAMAEKGEGECVVLNLMRPKHDIAGAGDVTDTLHCSRGTDCLQMAVAEGASGTIRRSVEPDVFFHAIRTVALGNAWYDAGTAGAMVRAIAARRATDTHALSPRELDVTGLISVGNSNKEIAQALGIGVPTVKKHVGHILEKLGVQDRLQIGLYVARNPLLLQLTGGRRP